MEYCTIKIYSEDLQTIKKMAIKRNVSVIELISTIIEEQRTFELSGFERSKSEETDKLIIAFKRMMINSHNDSLGYYFHSKNNLIKIYRGIHQLMSSASAHKRWNCQNTYHASYSLLHLTLRMLVKAREDIKSDLELSRALLEVFPLDVVQNYFRCVTRAKSNIFIPKEY